jgi:peptide-methionine (S)-S-oxide reductase
MKLFFSTLLAIFGLVSCAQNPRSQVRIPAGEKGAPVAGEAVATFAEGCFWHSEIVFQSLAGVRDAVSGYAGGHAASPNYDMVSTGSTGHAESVQVYYDPKKISYKTLVAAFFASQNPTTRNRQGADVGTEYRSVAFYRTEQEKEIILAEIVRVNNSGKYKNKVVTEVLPFTKFFPAEDNHQEYVLRNPGQGYVRSVSIPDFLEFKRTFKANYKP